MTSPYGVHKAQLAQDSEGFPPHCAVCGQWIKSVPGGWGPTWVHSDTGAVAAPNPPCYSPEATTWKLVQAPTGSVGTEPKVLATGTEREVKSAAQLKVDDAFERFHREHEALLRSDLYLVKPDGSHQGQKYDGAGFVPGEAIKWIDVDW